MKLMNNQDPQLAAEKKKMQIEILLKDSDLKKCMRSKVEVETTLRDLKRKETMIQVEILSKENQLKKIEAEYMQLQNELIKLKHQMSALSHK
jgi:DNA repair exonuclease SbcCD ATPase subunit